MVIIVKKVISTAKLPEVMLNSFGSAIIAIINPRRETDIVKPFNIVDGIQSEQRFKNPVNVITKIARVIYSFLFKISNDEFL